MTIPKTPSAALAEIVIGYSRDDAVPTFGIDSGVALCHRRGTFGGGTSACGSGERFTQAATPYASDGLQLNKCPVGMTNAPDAPLNEIVDASRRGCKSARRRGSLWKRLGPRHG